MITIADLPEDPHASPFDDDTVVSPPALTPAVEVAGRSSQPGLDGERRLTLREYRDQAERSYIVETLIESDWNISKAATVLGVERTNLHKKIRAYDIRRDG
ncbi:MAG: helix-turn-helix domain-containing protein [Polyangiaceae bacterium]